MKEITIIAATKKAALKNAGPSPNWLYRATANTPVNASTNKYRGGIGTPHDRHRPNRIR
jgi:hypothetical protein